MSVDRGKEWESLFKDLCESSDIDCIRLYDTLSGYKDVDNPCDFIISKSRELRPLLVECKATGSDRFDIRFRQESRLRDLKKFNSWVLIWFHERKKIWALSIDYIEGLLVLGKKSVNCVKLQNTDGCVELSAIWAIIKPKFVDFGPLWDRL